MQSPYGLYLTILRLKHRGEQDCRTTLLEDGLSISD
jgi:hypothetical protein